jgi:hypothetical protein
VVLHSGEFGGGAELCWEFNIGPLAADFRAIAPDWLGLAGRINCATLSRDQTA